MTQAALSARSGLDPSYISRLERGQRGVGSRETARKLAQALELDVADTNRILVAAGYVPLPDEAAQRRHPALGLITELFQDSRISDGELNPLVEYARLLDRLRAGR
jgi:transcriptional regulator with XRE-family HTH domain